MSANNPELLTWTEWLRTLLSFVVGMAVSYLTIMFQNASGDRHEQRKMRRVIYRELAEAIIWTQEVIQSMPPPRNPSDSNSEVIDPPSMRVLNSPYTFEGEEYMRQNREVSYSLPEMAQLKRMYVVFRRISETGQIVSVGEFKSPLVYFGREFTANRVIRKSFKKFARVDFSSLERILNYYADHRIKPEEIMRLVRDS